MSEEEKSKKESKYQSLEYRKVHEESLMDFNRAQSGQREEREQALQDRRFYSIAGAQWESRFGLQFENKPKLEVNKIHLAIIRIINEWLNNRITVNFVSKDGSKNDDLADLLDGMYRADENRSSANEAYDNAFEEAVGGGIGGWRLRTCYDDEYDEENEKQYILLDPIYDFDGCVYFDLDAMRQDKSDAKKCWVLTAYTTEAFKDEFDEDPSTWNKEVEEHEFDWDTPNFVYVAEYYEVEEATETLKIYRTLDQKEESYSKSDFEHDEDLEQKLLYSGATFDRERRIKRRKVHKYLMSGNGILEDCGYVAGTEIPIIPMYGKRWVVDSIERFMGHVRLAKDAQRLINMLRSWLAEIAALSPKEKPIFTAEQMAGHSPMWEDDNIKNYPYLLVNSITDKDGNEIGVGPVGYTRVPNIPPAMAALLQITEQDLKDLLGNPEAGEKMISNIGEKTVELIQNRLDMQSFVYMSNMSKAVKRCGDIWLGMAKDTYVEPNRKMKTLTTNGETGTAELSKPSMNPETGEIEYKNDIRKANYEVVVKVGPSSSSRRAATVKALTQMMQINTDPETAQVLGAMVMMNMEGEGIDDVRGYYRKKLLRLGVIKPTDEEAQELIEEAQNQPPDANETYLNAAAQEAEANAAKARSGTIKTIADAELSKAKTVETLAGVDRDDQKAAIETAKAIDEALGGRPTIEQGETSATFQPQMGENLTTGL